MVDGTRSTAVELRIEWFILMLGAAMTLVAWIGWGKAAGEGAALGAALCWLNFRWLRQGATAVTRLGLAQAGLEHVKIPKKIYAKFFGRLILLVVIVYAILTWLHLPALAVVSGLTAVFPAILAELGFELMRGHDRWNAP
jgi:ATP synthase I chain